MKTLEEIKEEREGLPRSENLGRYESEEYFITAAEWESQYNHCYEIGIREKKNHSAFTLLQGNWDAETVKIAAMAVTKLLDNGFDPQALRKIF